MSFLDFYFGPHRGCRFTLGSLGGGFGYNGGTWVVKVKSSVGQVGVL
jgi:hypothetical protein